MMLPNLTLFAIFTQSGKRRISSMIGGGYSKFMCYICHENDALPLYSDGGSQLVRLLCSYMGNGRLPLLSNLYWTRYASHATPIRVLYKIVHPQMKESEWKPFGYKKDLVTTVLNKSINISLIGSSRTHKPNMVDIL
ncbi:hypothetical protein BLOT_008905 [Blomia tropicalis]|nr:hypothetical protein BLOT_008905 [Blomia tropicalis]